jgi:YD repeat-containing protein
VDLNNDGNFTDPGESQYATGSLTNGACTISLAAAPLPGAGTYPMRARVTDLAGNEGSSAVSNVQVTSATGWSVAGQVLTADPLDGLALEQLGDVHVAHALDLDQSPGTDQSGNPALVYNSDSVSQLPIVQANLQSPNNASLPGSVSAVLTFNGTTAATVTYSTAGLAAGDTLTLAAQASSALTTTGRYAWSLLVMVPGQSNVTVTGIAYVVAQDSSPFGAGWTFSPVDHLYDIPADGNGPHVKLRAWGTGEWRTYTDAGGGAYTSMGGDNGTLSFSSNAYTYTTPDGQKWTFNSAGYQTGWASADGQEQLTFSYDNSNNLTGMTAIDGARTTFTYSSGLVSAIATANGRTTTPAYSGTDLTQVTNPDTGLHTFSYDASHHLTGETFANLQDEWAYGTSGTLSTLTWGGPTSPSVTGVAPAVVQGLAAAVRGPVTAATTDPLADVTRWQLDVRARPLQQTAADGGLTQWKRDGSTYVTAVVDPLGRTTSFARDSVGYVTQVTNPDGSTEGYAYQSAFHALTSATDERGDTTTYAYDSQGHETSTTNALAQTTNFGYANGLLTSVTDPLGHKNTLSYDTFSRVTQAQDAAGDTDSFTYDGNGNPATSTDALGRVTTTAFDVMSRLTKQTNALGGVSSMTYNTAGLLLSRTDALGRLSEVAYDGYSRGLVAAALAAVGTQAQADVLNSFDAAGEVTATRDADGWWSQLGYDPVGRPTQTTTRWGAWPWRPTIWPASRRRCATNWAAGRARPTTCARG